jgi:sugar-specific transcriptional regulator TrmB
MIHDKTHDLLKIGLTEGEAKVYLALSEIGSSTVGPIVKKARVAYSNVYDILQRLMEKGVVSVIIKNKTRYFQAASPSNLMDYLDKKEDKISKQKKALEKTIPELEKLQKIKPQQEAEVFLGTKGLKAAYGKLMSGAQANDENLFFYVHEDEYSKASDLFYLSITDMIKHVPTRGITNESYRKSKFMKKAKWIELRTVDFPVPGHIETCGNKVLLISWKKPMTATLIHSQNIAENIRNYFNSVWKIAKK